MTNSNAENMVIFNVDAGLTQRLGPDGRVIETRGTKETVVKASEVALETIKDNMFQFISGVQDILAKGASIGGEFHMKTVEITAQISADGKVGFAGTGVGLNANTGIKIVFERPGSTAQTR